MRASSARLLRSGRSFWLGVLGLLLCSGIRGLGGENLLVNPGFELNASGATDTIVAWTPYGRNGGNVAGQTGAVALGGTHFFKVYQAFTGGVNYSGIYQDHASGPGAVYVASGWAQTQAADALAGENVAWIEVTFRDAVGRMLALYRSSLITTNTLADHSFPADTWVALAITNQYDPTTYQRTGTVNRLVAPGGTSFVRYQVVFQGDAHYSAGSVYFDDLELERIEGAPFGRWNVVWNDEFDGTSVDRDRWTFETGTGAQYGIPGWGNNELEYYTDRAANAFVSGGRLNLVARQESFGDRPYTSARLKSAGLFSRRYGRFEFRARLPQGVGFWPALWMMPRDSVYGGWPASGEVDVMENKGSELTRVGGTIHYGASGNHQYATGSFELPTGTVTEFHNYMVEWTSNAFNWYVDGLLYETQTNWWSARNGTTAPYPAPFDQPFYLIMNLAVGGNFLGNPSQEDINEKGVWPGVLQVDYVRVYELTDPLRVSASATNASLLLTWPSNIVCRLQTSDDPMGAHGWSDLDSLPGFFAADATNLRAYFRLASP